MTATRQQDPGTAVTVGDKSALSVGERPATIALVRPAASPVALMELHKEIAQVVAAILVPGTDYGQIPGTGDKPSLLKPGAERVAFAFGCAPKYEVVDRQIDHDRAVQWTKRKKVWRNAHRGDREFTWQEESGSSLGLYRYEVRCTLVRREDGATVAEGIASCSTMESKYVDRPRDTENTVLKMAQKRAFVAAVLNGFGLSDRFTQDVEDLPQDHPAAPANGAPANADGLTPLQQALDYPLPGKPTSWEGCGSKALKLCPSKLLGDVLKWAEKKIADGEKAPVIAELRDKVKLVIGARASGEVEEPGIPPDQGGVGESRMSGRAPTGDGYDAAAKRDRKGQDHSVKAEVIHPKPLTTRPLPADPYVPGDATEDDRGD